MASADCLKIMHCTWTAQIWLGILNQSRAAQTGIPKHAGLLCRPTHQDLHGLSSYGPTAKASSVGINSPEKVPSVPLPAYQTCMPLL